MTPNNNTVTIHTIMIVYLSCMMFNTVFLYLVLIDNLLHLYLIYEFYTISTITKHMEVHTNPPDTTFVIIIEAHTVPFIRPLD